ncbi:MAG: hypothetical protein ACYDEI_02760 [Erysipelotrichaceae bacterium]
MLTIKKFKNVYGIKDLIKPELIKGNTIIYAPNGVMKSSFSHGINTIKNGEQIPRDVVNNIDSEFEIEFDGQTITHNSSNRKFRAVIFSDGINESSIFENPNIASLAISQKLRARYDACIKKNDLNTQPFEQIIQTNLLGISRKSAKSIELLNQIFGGKDCIESIINIPESFNIIPEKILSIPFQSIFNPSVEAIAKGEEFKNRIESYISILKKEFDKKYFSNGFTLNGLISLFEQAKESGFFLAGHKFQLGNDILSSEEVENLINNTIISIFNQKEVKQAFENTTKLFKKKETKELEVQLTAGSELIEFLINYDLFKKDFVINHFTMNISNINELKLNLIETMKEIEEILKDAANEENTWNEVLDLFNLRFKNKIENIQIVNDKDAKIGRKPPIFSIRHSESNNEITPEIERRFSAGEKRTILILNILYEIAMMQKEEGKFLVIFDDIIESFDYKNKYAILQYLKEFSGSDKMQLIILTHNFDFYRSCRHVMDDDLLNSKLMAYSKNRIVTLYKNEQEYYDDLSYFNNWKNTREIRFILPLIPFLRNSEQLRNNKAKYVSLCRFVHYNEETENLKLSDIKEIFDEENVCLPERFDERTYLEHLSNVIDGLLNKVTINETQLEAKINLGLFIRVFMERFLWKKYVEIYQSEPINLSKYDKTNELYNKIKPNLTKEEIITIDTCLITSPSFIHVNSFMYEPLIDIGCERLIESANLLKKLIK